LALGDDELKAPARAARSFPAHGVHPPTPARSAAAGEASLTCSSICSVSQSEVTATRCRASACAEVFTTRQMAWRTCAACWVSGSEWAAKKVRLRRVRPSERVASISSGPIWPYTDSAQYE